MFFKSMLEEQILYLNLSTKLVNFGGAENKKWHHVAFFYINTF